MGRGTARVVSACIALMVTCVWQPMTAIELPSGSAASLLTFLAIPRADTAFLPHSPDDADFADTYNLPPSALSGGYESDESSGGPERRKRVFLSRGWGPGGYEAPQPPQRFVRRPPLPPTRLPQPQPLPQAQKNKGIGGSRFAALVSNQQQPPPNQPNTQYRRFHSIFTSGTWSPLGKRGGIHTAPEERREFSDADDEDELEISGEKRSAVFASHGWGAGGSSTPRKQLWTPAAANSLRPMEYPQATSLSQGSWESGPAASGPQRHASSFQTVGVPQQRKPLLHLFVSNGWGPMGR